MVWVGSPPGGTVNAAGLDDNYRDSRQEWDWYACMALKLSCCALAGGTHGRQCRSGNGAAGDAALPARPYFPGATVCSSSAMRKAVRITWTVAWYSQRGAGAYFGCYKNARVNLRW